jgi:hypothetical protein
MTRRDYCSECSEMVNDCDVYAECGHNQCHGCIVPYDYKTALFAMNGRFNVMCEPEVLVKEIEPFQKQVETMLVDMSVFRTTEITKYGNYYDESMSELTEQIPDMMNDFKILIQKYKNVDPDTIIPHDNAELQELMCIFDQCFQLIREFGIYQFICHRCHAQDIRDKYVADLEVENAKLRQENAELNERLNMANEDKKTG